MREFVNHIHFVGMGGIGMSGIAEVLLEQKYTVSGSDLNPGPVLTRLGELGATTFVGHAAEQIKGADVVVISSAVDDSNPEVAAAYLQGIPVVPRAEMLGELMRFRQGIAIAGTHGKTTTTSLAATILVHAGLDPTFIIGGIVHSESSNARLGQGDYLVAEADESDASFLQLTPQVSVVTNIDADHMETYGNDFEQLKSTFVSFLHKLPFYGLAVMCFDDPVVQEIAKLIHRRVISYGFSDGVDVQAVNFSQQGALSYFEVSYYGKPLGKFELSLPGKHNALNALAAITIAHKLGVSDEDMRAALKAFKGVGRRFEVLGEVSAGQGQDQDRVLLVDDYAHHPSELAATLAAANEVWPDQRRVILFQPHRYSRTQSLFDDFAATLAEVDSLVLLDVYPAGEKPISGADGRCLAKAIRARGGKPIFVADFDEASNVLAHQLEQGGVLLTLGAGDIGRYARQLASGELTLGVEE